MHTFIRQKLPFTYATYRSFILKEEDDLLEVIKEVGDGVTLRYFFFFCGELISPYLIFLPMLPFIFDGIWNLSSHKDYTYLNPDQASKYKKQFDVKIPRMYSNADVVRSVAYLAFLSLGVYVIEAKVPFIKKLIRD